MQSALVVAMLTLGFIAVMFLVVRPIVVRLVSRSGDRPPTREAIALALGPSSFARASEGEVRAVVS